MTELSLTIDHVSLSVEDLERAKNFYSKALAPLGLEVVGEVTAEQSGSVAFGVLSDRKVACFAGLCELTRRRSRTG